MILIRAARAAAVTSRPQQKQKPKEWQPFAKLVWLVFLIGIPVEMFGWLPVVLTIAGLAGFAVILTLAVRSNASTNATRRGRRP